MSFEMERYQDLFLFRLNGPFQINVADVIGNNQQAIWSTFFKEKQVNSNQILRKVMGGPYPLTDLYRILCGDKSEILETKETNGLTTYSNDSIRITISDFQQVDHRSFPTKIEFFAEDDHVTELNVYGVQLGDASYILSEQYQARKDRITAVPLALGQ